VGDDASRYRSVRGGVEGCLLANHSQSRMNTDFYRLMPLDNC
jgi:hypothetical protein